MVASRYIKKNVKMKYTNCACGWYANTIKLRCLGLNIYNLYHMYGTVIRCVYQFSYNRTFFLNITDSVLLNIFNVMWVSYTTARRRETYKIVFFFVHMCLCICFTEPMICLAARWLFRKIFHFSCSVDTIEHWNLF